MYDVIVMDIDSKDVSVDTTCPPPQFLEASFLENVETILSNKGNFQNNGDYLNEINQRQWNMPILSSRIYDLSC